MGLELHLLDAAPKDRVAMSSLPSPHISITHNAKHILHGDMKTTNIFVFWGAQEPVVKIGDLGSALHLDAFGVDSASYIQRCTTTYNYAPPEML